MISRANSGSRTAAVHGTLKQTPAGRWDQGVAEGGRPSSQPFGHGPSYVAVCAHRPAHRRQLNLLAENIGNEMIDYLARKDPVRELLADENAARAVIRSSNRPGIGAARQVTDTVLGHQVAGHEPAERAGDEDGVRRRAWPWSARSCRRTGPAPSVGTPPVPGRYGPGRQVRETVRPEQVDDLSQNLLDVRRAGLNSRPAW